MDATAPLATCDSGRTRWLTARNAWLWWCIFFAAIAVAVARDPDRVVTHNYREASLAWFEGRGLYEEGVHGFLYFPHAAILFSPFALLPVVLGGVLWRAVGIGALAAAAWRLSGLVGQRRYPSIFPLMTLLVIPTGLSSARNGQMNMVLTALMALAYVALATRRWNAAAAWLCLGMAVKPLMVVPMFAVVLAYRPAVRPLLLGLVVLALGPFLTQDPVYVWGEYRHCLEKLTAAGNPGPMNPHTDLFGLLSAVGWAVPLGWQTVVRAAALAMLSIGCWFVRRRWNAARAGIFCLGLTSCYLALCNPRMENNGFLVLGPTLGALGALALLRERRPAVVWLTAIVAVGIAGSYEITRGPNFWLSPLLSLLLLLYVVHESLVGRRSAKFDVATGRRQHLPQRSQFAPGASATAGDHDLTVIIPAYNEAARLPRTLKALAAWLDAQRVDYRVLVVDDGSQDETPHVAERFGALFRTLRGPRQGKGAAVRRGMLAATGRVVAFTDADLPYDLASLGAAYEAIDANRCEVVFGARDVPGAAATVPRRLTRVAASFVFRGITRLLVSQEVTDTQCGLKVFSSRAAKAIFSRSLLDGFAFDAEVVWLCHQLRLPLRRVPVTLVDEYGSTLSVSRHAWGMLFDVLRFRFLHADRPAAMFGDGLRIDVAETAQRAHPTHPDRRGLPRGYNEPAQL